MRRLMLGIAVAVTSLMPTLGIADDQQIADYIKNRLQNEQQNGRLQGFNVDMRVDRGTVWFQGHVSSDSQEQMILRTAQEAGYLGVVQVVDDIDVKSMVQQSYSVMEQQAPQHVAQLPEPNQVPAPAQAAVYQQQPERHVPYQQTSMLQEQGSGAVYSGQPLPFANASARSYAPAPAPQQYQAQGYSGGGAPMPASYGNPAMPAEAPNLPGYSWPGYAAAPNYSAVTYPKQYSPSAWPYIGPFYPYPQVPLGWRKVTLEWDDGWWMLDFNDK